MLILRIAAIVVVLAAAAGVLLFFFTRDRKYLRFAFQVFKYSLIVALVLFGMLVAERVMVLI